jgi:hypothetical protein
LELKIQSNPQEIQLNEDLPKANKIIEVAEALGIDINNIAAVGEETLKKIAEQTDVPLPDVFRLTGYGNNRTTIQNLLHLLFLVRLIKLLIT